MLISRNFVVQALQRPGCVSFRAEKHRPLVVIDAGDRVASVIKVNADLGADEPARARDQNALVFHVSLACHFSPQTKVPRIAAPPSCCQPQTRRLTYLNPAALWPTLEIFWNSNPN